jgi:hypothetical protein
MLAFEGCLEKSLNLGFLGVSRAPAVCVNLLACKQGATASSVCGLALEQSAVVAFLGSGMLREFLGVNLGGVGGITQGCSLGVFFIDQGLSHGLLGCQSGTTQCHLHHENAAVSLFHKISNEVAKNLNGRILPLKMKVCWRLLAYQTSIFSGGVGQKG